MELDRASSSTVLVGSYSSQKDNTHSYDSHTLFKAKLSPRKPQTLFSNSHVRGLVLTAFFSQEPCLKDYYFLSSQFREHIMTRRRVSESTS